MTSTIQTTRQTTVVTTLGRTTTVQVSTLPTQTITEHFSLPSRPLITSEEPIKILSEKPIKITKPWTTQILTSRSTLPLTSSEATEMRTSVTLTGENNTYMEAAWTKTQIFFLNTHLQDVPEKRGI